jgi:hypothetical protein
MEISDDSPRERVLQQVQQMRSDDPGDPPYQSGDASPRERVLEQVRALRQRDASEQQPSAPDEPDGGTDAATTEAIRTRYPKASASDEGVRRGVRQELQAEDAAQTGLSGVWSQIKRDYQRGAARRDVNQAAKLTDGDHDPQATSGGLLGLSLRAGGGVDVTRRADEIQQQEGVSRSDAYDRASSEEIEQMRQAAIEEAAQHSQQVEDEPGHAGTREVARASQRGIGPLAQEALSGGLDQRLTALTLGQIARQPSALAVGVAGSAAAGPAGAALAGSAAGGRVEAQAALPEELRRAGVDMTNPDEIEAALEDPDLLQRARERARQRGVAIGAADLAANALTMGLGRTAMRPLSKALSGLATQTAGEGVGEYAAQKAAGDEVSTGEIGLEMLAGGAQSTAETALLQGGPEALRRAKRENRREAAGEESTAGTDEQAPAREEEQVRAREQTESELTPKSQVQPTETQQRGPAVSGQQQAPRRREAQSQSARARVMQAVRQMRSTPTSEEQERRGREEERPAEERTQAGARGGEQRERVVQGELAPDLGARTPSEQEQIIQEEVAAAEAEVESARQDLEAKRADLRSRGPARRKQARQDLFGEQPQEQPAQQQSFEGMEERTAEREDFERLLEPERRRLREAEQNLQAVRQEAERARQDVRASEQELELREESNAQEGRPADPARSASERETERTPFRSEADDRYEVRPQEDGTLKVINRETEADETERSGAVGRQSSKHDDVLAEYFRERATAIDRRAPETPFRGRSRQQYQETVAKESQNPVEIAEAYEAARAQAGEGVGQAPIARALQEAGRVTPASLERFARRGELIERGLGNWASSEGRDLNNVARDLSRELGEEVTPQQLVDVMQDHPGGASSMRSESERLQEDLADRFREVTGKTLTPDLADEITSASRYGSQPQESQAQSEPETRASFQRSGEPSERRQGAAVRAREGAAETDTERRSQAGGRALRARVEEALSGLEEAGLPAANVSATSEQLPSIARRQYEGGQQGGQVTPGFYIGDQAGSGTAYLIADDIEQAAQSAGLSVEEQARRTYLHEVVGHQGIDAFIGDAERAQDVRARLAEIIGTERMTNALRSGQSLFDLYMPEGVSSVKDASQKQKALLADEYLAHLAEGGVRVDRNVIQRIFDFLRRQLTRFRAAFGRAPTDAELKLMLEAGARRLQAQKANREVGPSRFSRRGQGEPQTAFERRFQERLRAESEAAAEGEPNEVGQAELATPAESEEVRSAVDVADQLRKEAGAPDPETFEEWRDEANERLEADYETEKRRLAQQEGGFDKIDVMMAKQIIEREGLEALQAGDDALLEQFARITNSYREEMTETARTLAAGRDPSKTPAERRKEHLMEAIFMPSGEEARNLQRAETKAERDRAMNGHLENVKTITEALRKHGLDFGQAGGDGAAGQAELFFDSPRKVAQAVRVASSAKSSIGDKFYEYWINSILSALTTQFANVVGNTAHAAWDFSIQRAVEASINEALPGGQENAEVPRLGELKHLYSGLTAATMRNAWRRAQLAFDVEAPVLEEELGLKGQTYREGTESYEVAISGAKGRAIRTPGRLLVAGDQIFKSTFHDMQVGAEAYRQAKAEGLEGEALRERIEELVATPQSVASMRAYQTAKRLTFQEDVGPVGGIIKNWRAQAENADTPLGRFVGWVGKYQVPFLRTMMNLIKKGLRMTPQVAGLNLLYRGAAHGLYATGVTDNAHFKYRRREVVKHAAEAALGAAAWWGVGLMMESSDEGDEPPMITGTRSAQFGERQAQYRSQQPMSIRIGDTYYSYARIEPFATPLASIVDGHKQLRDLEEGKPLDEVIGSLGGSLMNIVEEKTFAKGINDLFRLREYGGAYLSRFVRDFGTSWVPNIIRKAAASRDDVFREYEPRAAEPESWPVTWTKRMLQEAVPVETWQPPPRVGLWGREASRGVEGASPYTDWLYRITTPIWRQEADPIRPDRWLLNYNNEHPNAGFWPTVPEATFTREGKEIRMTSQEYHDYLTRSGTRVRQRVQELIENGTLDINQPRAEGKEKVERILRAARRQTKEKMLREGAFQNATPDQRQQARDGGLLDMDLDTNLNLDENLNLDLP